MARAYHLKSILFKENSKQQVDTAIIYYNKAIGLLADGTANELLSSVYRELSTVYTFRNDFPKALKYMEVGKDSSDRHPVRFNALLQQESKLIYDNGRTGFFLSLFTQMYK